MGAHVIEVDVVELDVVVDVQLVVRIVVVEPTVVEVDVVYLVNVERIVEIGNGGRMLPTMSPFRSFNVKPCRMN